MRYTLEFDPERMFPLDYAAVSGMEYRLLTGDQIEDLIDYVEGMGYEWLWVCYVWQVPAA